MKKVLRRWGIIAGLAAAIIAVTLSGCSLFSSPKTFEKAGMSITLTGAFTEEEVVSQTVCYRSRTSIVTALKEDFTTAGISEDWTVAEYTDAVLNGNNMPSLQVNSREGKDYLYFEYEKTVSGNDFYYFATTHKGEDAFWLIQFACFQSQKDKFTEKFFTWADSIIISSAAVA